MRIKLALTTLILALVSAGYPEYCNDDEYCCFDEPREDKCCEVKVCKVKHCDNNCEETFGVIGCPNNG
jgi:hypothetical protein